MRSLFWFFKPNFCDFNSFLLLLLLLFRSTSYFCIWWIYSWLYWMNCHFRQDIEWLQVAFFPHLCVCVYVCVCEREKERERECVCCFSFLLFYNARPPACRRIFNLLIMAVSINNGSRNSLLVRVPDWWSKDCKFEPRKEWHENFLLQS